jgi:hypothetical protein
MTQTDEEGLIIIDLGGDNDEDQLGPKGDGF